MKRKAILTLLIVLCFNTNRLYAQSEWLGRWHSDPIEEDNEKVVMEYNFKDESIMSMSFFTDCNIFGVGRCVSKLSLNGTYNKYGPYFIVSLDSRSLNVDVIKFEGSNEYIAREKALNYLKSRSVELFYGVSDISMLYATHESPDTISFIYGDGDNAMELVFHRPDVSAISLPFTDSNTLSSLKVPENKNRPHSENESLDNLSPMAKMWMGFGIFMLYLLLAFTFIGGMKYLFEKNLSRQNSAQKSVRIRIIYFTATLVSKEKFISSL